MEWCDLYDKQGNLTGETIRRGDPIPQGSYRLVAGVLCMHKDGSILLVKRHPEKPTHPNLYEASASGSVLAGETAEAAAIRELQEETGLCCDTVTLLYEESDECRLYRGFLAQMDCDKASVRLQAEEAVDYRWVSRQELENLNQQKPSPVILHRGIIRYLGLERNS